MAWQLVGLYRPGSDGTKLRQLVQDQSHDNGFPYMHAREPNLQYRDRLQSIQSIETLYRDVFQFPVIHCKLRQRQSYSVSR